MTLSQLRLHQDARRARVTVEDLRETLQAFLAGDPPLTELVECRGLLRSALGAPAPAPPQTTPPPAAAPAAAAPAEVEFSPGPPTHPTAEGVSHGS